MAHMAAPEERLTSNLEKFKDFMVVLDTALTKLDSRESCSHRSSANQCSRAMQLTILQTHHFRAEL